MDNAEVIRSFYAALQRRDGAALGAAYAPDARFEDAVFTLSGWEVPAMWRMLCARAVDLRVEFRDVRVDRDSGSAHWEAWYTFSPTGRPVHNIIDATMTLRGGKILTHHDRFDFRRWSAQALGLTGRLFGWTPMLHAAVRRRSARALATYAANHPLTGTP
ncbi:MAG TPA: nuclear transport factor 2 family protein [Gemmatimonadales bacterium]|nr:nuclear transport factor 2 family protein [Gemmatimonadales bacterium]